MTEWFRYTCTKAIKTYQCPQWLSGMAIHTTGSLNGKVVYLYHQSPQWLNGTDIPLVSSMTSGSIRM